MVGLVFGPIGVEQVHRHPADVHPPRVKPHGAAGEPDAAHQRLTLRIQYRLQGQVAGIQEGVGFLLPVVVVDRLLKVALAVEEADADKAEAEIRGRLGVIAGQRAEAARGNGKRLVKGEFGREISHRVGLQ